MVLVRGDRYLDYGLVVCVLVMVVKDLVIILIRIALNLIESTLSLIAVF